MTDQEQAFWEGRAAQKDGKAAFENPYKDGALFDERQLADWWYQGYKASLDAKACARQGVVGCRLGSAQGAPVR